MLKPMCTKLVFTRAFSGLYSSLPLMSYRDTMGPLVYDEILYWSFPSDTSTCSEQP